MNDVMIGACADEWIDGRWIQQHGMVAVNTYRSLNGDIRESLECIRCGQVSNRLVRSR